MSAPLGTGASNQDVLRHQRTFWVVWSGQSVSVLGNAVYSIALLFWIATLPGPAGQTVGALAVLGVLLSLPRLALGPFLAGWVDRFSRQWIMCAVDALRGLAMTGIWLLLVAGSLTLWQVYLAALLDALCTALHEPAFEASIANLVPESLLHRANGLVQSSFAVANVVGPLSGGLLIASLGLPTLFALNALSFWLAAGTMLLIRLPQQVPAREPDSSLRHSWQRLWRDATIGFRYIVQQRVLFLLLLLFTASNLVGGPVQTLLPLLVLGPLHGTAQTLGLVNAAAEAGVLVSSVLISLGWLRFGRPAWGVAVGIGVGGVGALFTGVCAGLRSTAGVVGSAFVDAGAIPISGVHNSVIWQRSTPDELRGRVFAARRIIGQGTYPLGIALAAPAAALFGVVPLVIGCGVLAVLIGGLGFVLTPLRTQKR